MPGWLKILLIILLIGILLVVGVIAAAGIWFYRNKDELVAKTKAMAEDHVPLARTLTIRAVLMKWFRATRPIRDLPLRSQMRSSCKSA